MDSNHIRIKACVYATVLCIACCAAAEPATKQLGSGVGKLRFQGAPFTSAIDELQKAAGQKVSVNWRALEQVKVIRSLPVTTDLSDLSLGQALDRLLAEVGGTHTRLTWIVDSGVATVTTEEESAKNVSTRVYDIRRGIKGSATSANDVAAIINRVLGIDPLSWKTAGGRTGSVRELSGQLIVTQTPEVHERIARELSDLLPPTP